MINTSRVLPFFFFLVDIVLLHNMGEKKLFLTPEAEIAKTGRLSFSLFEKKNVIEQTPSSQKMYLSGYGVELAIKSTEYKALDDTQVKSKFILYI